MAQESVVSIGPTRSEYQQKTRKKLSKAEIVNGTKATRDHYVKAWDGYVTIRPLSEGEWQIVRQNYTRGITHRQRYNPKTEKQEDYMDIDYSVQNEGAVEADRLIVAFGLSNGGEHWTPEEISQMSPATVVEEIAQEVLKLSGINPRQQRRKRDATDTEYQEDEGSDLTDQVDSFPEDA